MRIKYLLTGDAGLLTQQSQGEKLLAGGEIFELQPNNANAGVY